MCGHCSLTYRSFCLTCSSSGLYRQESLFVCPGQADRRRWCLRRSTRSGVGALAYFRGLARCSLVLTRLLCAGGVVRVDCLRGSVLEASEINAFWSCFFCVVVTGSIHEMAGEEAFRAARGGGKKATPITRKRCCFDFILPMTSLPKVYKQRL